MINAVKLEPHLNERTLPHRGWRSRLRLLKGKPSGKCADLLEMRRLQTIYEASEPNGN